MPGFLEAPVAHYERARMRARQAGAIDLALDYQPLICGSSLVVSLCKKIPDFYLEGGPSKHR